MVFLLWAGAYTSGLDLVSMDLSYSPDETAFRDTVRAWLAANLPAGGPVKVVREDPKNAMLLYAGTEFGLFASTSRGRSWFKLGGRMFMRCTKPACDSAYTTSRSSGSNTQ